MRLIILLLLLLLLIIIIILIILILLILFILLILLIIIIIVVVIIIIIIIIFFFFFFFFTTMMTMIMIMMIEPRQSNISLIPASSHHAALPIEFRAMLMLIHYCDPPYNASRMSHSVLWCLILCALTGDQHSRSHFPLTMLPSLAWPLGSSLAETLTTSSFLPDPPCTCLSMSRVCQGNQQPRAPPFIIIAIVPFCLLTSYWSCCCCCCC